MQTWTTKLLTYEGRPLFLRYPEILDYESLEKAYPILIVIAHELSIVNTNGLPDPDYNDSLFLFDENLRKTFTLDGCGVTILIETFSGKRKYYIYVNSKIDVAEVIAKLKLNHPNEKLTYSIHPDSNWSFIKKYSKAYHFYK